MKLLLSAIEVNTFKNSANTFYKALDKATNQKLARNFNKDFNRLKQKGVIKNKLGTIQMDKDGNVEVFLKTGFVTGYTSTYFRTSEKLVEPTLVFVSTVKEQASIMEEFFDKWKPKKG